MLLLHTLNLFLVHLILFSTIIPKFSPSFSCLYREDIVISTVEIHVRYMFVSWQDHGFLKSSGKIWNLQVKVLGSLLFNTVKNFYAKGMYFPQKV